MEPVSVLKKFMNIRKINSIGIVGANITSMLLCIEAKKRGIETILLDQDVDNIAADYATTCLVAPFDRSNLERLALRTDCMIFTTNILEGTTDELDGALPVYPNFAARTLLTDRVKQIVMAEELKINLPDYFVCEDLDDIEETHQILTIPYRCYQYFRNDLEIYLIDSEQAEIEVESLLNIEEGMCVFEQIKDYKQILSITVLRDNYKNISLYPIVQEKEDEDSSNSQINVPANITKSNVKKIETIVKRIVRYMDSAGVFTFRFGITHDRQLEWVGMTPGVNVADIYTNHYTTLSVYEQFMNIIENNKAIPVTLTEKNCVYITDNSNGFLDIEQPYHLYRMMLQDRDNINIYVIPEREEDIEV
ncbi:MAG: hypothetical protein ATN33_00850 [Epulopiscium sp. Nele67-Bin001]|nr:MAG: hypothetical protein BEN18_07165 [Epulopiscium sp. Nuni2H_MBin001]OON91574.1 MAG: hypothetical protein ATN33_00850 [Epulopiscium sp. Nele67-Bin001]